MQAIASGGGTPQLSEVRFSTRRAAKVANYDEEQDLGISEEDDSETATPQYYYVEDDSPAIDQVLNHKLKEGVGKCCTARLIVQNTSDRAMTEASNSAKQDYEFYVSHSPHVP
jgi:chromodomain-helicase-DNA-binding protein 1